MNGNANMISKAGEEAREDPSREAGAVPVLELRVFGGFDAYLGGKPVDSPSVRQRRVQTLFGILAVNHGQELYSDYVADSIWPRSSPEKKRHCFYNLWYLATRAVYAGRREDNPYFERRQYTCRLLDGHVRTDVEEVELACRDLARPDLTPAGALEAYRRLQRAYRGDLLPGEAENAIVIRARRDWRERVADALSTAAHALMAQGEDRTALWLATAASRLSGLREDIARLRIRLYAKMGMQAYAVRTFNELEDFLRDEVGMRPSPQSFQLMRQVVDAGDLELAISAGSSPRRRGKAGARGGGDGRKKARPAFGDALPARADALPHRM